MVTPTVGAQATGAAAPAKKFPLSTTTMILLGVAVVAVIGIVIMLIVL
jgi:hypothetical protein